MTSSSVDFETIYELLFKFQNCSISDPSLSDNDFIKWNGWTILKETFAVWEFHWKSSTFLKLIFWPRNGNIDQFLGLNMKVHHSRFPKPNFIFMIHHYDVINRPIYKGFSKMNLTHHSLCFHSIRISFWNSSTTGKIQGVWIVPIHRILSEVRKFPWSLKSLFDT